MFGFCNKFKLFAVVMLNIIWLIVQCHVLPLFVRTDVCFCLIGTRIHVQYAPILRMWWTHLLVPKRSWDLNPPAETSLCYYIILSARVDKWLSWAPGESNLQYSSVFHALFFSVDQQSQDTVTTGTPTTVLLHSSNNWRKKKFYFLWTCTKGNFYVSFA